MNNFIYVIIGFITLSTISCQQNTGPKKILTEERKTSNLEMAQSISPEGSFSTAPFITKDAENNVVVCWTEKLPGEEKKSILKYRISKDGGENFGKTIVVTPSSGTKAHHESMNKVAFKKDNTVVAVYSLSPANSKNRFASDIFFTQSSDDGKTWVNPKKVHQDTIGTSHSFFDIATLPNGEVGCIWLNPGKDRGGRPVMFAQTKENNFVNETMIDKIACQCCRTELFIDPQGSINVVYRDLINDSIRDMVISKSTDLGKTFSSPTRISKDNWAINGCPHTGPTMTFNQNKLQFAWFTMGGGEGLFFTESLDDGKSFFPRKLVDESAKHPQMVSLNENETILVWDEPYLKNDSTYGHIVYTVISKGEFQQKQYITDENIHAQFPVILKLNDNNALVAWVQMENNNSYIFVKVLNFGKSVIG